MKTTTYRSTSAGGLRLRKTTQRVNRTGKSTTLGLTPPSLRLKSILVPIDFSETSREGLAVAAGLASQCGGKLTLVHVVEPVAAPEFAAVSLLIENDAARKSAKAKLDAFLAELGIPLNLVEKTLVRFGAPFAEIAAAAKTLKADLIVVTTHGYTGLKHVLMGSTAERVVRHAPCAVLTVRQKR